MIRSIPESERFHRKTSKIDIGFSEEWVYNTDEAVNIEQSEMMYRVLKEHNVEAEFFVLEGAGHGADDFYQDEILEEVEAFLRDK